MEIMCDNCGWQVWSETEWDSTCTECEETDCFFEVECEDE